LTVLNLALGPLSGAHFNPAVTLSFTLQRKMPGADAAAYIAAQVTGAVIGVWAAHLMFDLPVMQISTAVRSGWSIWFAEFVATFGLILTIYGCLARAPEAVAYSGRVSIPPAHLFNASTPF